MKRQETSPEFIRFPRPIPENLKVRFFHPEDVIFIIAAVVAIILFYYGFRGL